MPYIIMALDECGDEIRVNDFDKHSRGFDWAADAYLFLDKAREYYPEYSRFWVEELKDSQYWMERLAREDYDPEEDYER